MRSLKMILVWTLICLVCTSTSARDRLNNGGEAPSVSGQAGEGGQSEYPSDIGVYMNADKHWVDMDPEIANRKTGGVLKTVATGGVINGDVNGSINGAASPNRLSLPVEFLVVVPDGVAITEYQLVRLHVQKNSREFRATTGGVFHQSSGATRDLVQFEGKKVAGRTYLVSVAKLKPGEYGFLPPGTIESPSNFSLGKIYTFGVRE
ncbi:MAG TPA: hypothetical protein VEZ90_17000 [Blastocatellia bacterium]|nr:hypothetical protein [Blastocatellia bacterium]